MKVGDGDGKEEKSTMINYYDYYLQEEAVTRVSTSHDRHRLLLLVLLGSLTFAAVGAALGLFLMLR